MSYTNARPKASGRKSAAFALPLLMLVSTLPAWAGGVTVTAAASFSKKLNQVVVTGKTSGIAAGSYVKVYNAVTDAILYAVKTDEKGRYEAKLPDTAGLDKIPCAVRVETAHAGAIANVGGADKSCKTALVCNVGVSADNIRAGETVALSAWVKGKNAAKSLGEWDAGDGLHHREMHGMTPNGSGAFASQPIAYPNPGRYTASFSATDGSGNGCTRSVTVGVAPAAVPGLPAKVAERPRPAFASGMSGDYVVLPFEEKSEVGVNQLGLPYSSYIATQGLNAQVFLKDPKKPVPQGLQDLEVFYSAASNPTDPVGADSINSTSQNWFADGTTGANFDNSAANANAGNLPKKQTALLADKRVEDAMTLVKKSGFWDRLKNSDDNGSSAAAYAFRKSGADLVKLDQGIRHKLDSGADLRAMPGIAAPYLNNDPQPLKAYNPLGYFSAPMIPLTDVDDKGRTNPYPLMRVEAKKAGRTVAAADAVLASSSEFKCRDCHAKGQIAADGEVWRTPVTLEDTLESRGFGTHRPDKGKTSYEDNAVWPGALHNRFELKPSANGQLTVINDFDGAEHLRTDIDTVAAYKPFSPEGTPPPGKESTKIRGDRVSAARWVNGKLQIKLKFYEPENDTWQAQEKAALNNVGLLHDYMVLYGTGKNIQTQYADTMEDKVKSSRAHAVGCAGHHGVNTLEDAGLRGTSSSSKSDYSRAEHAFHGRMQVYKEDMVIDGVQHKKGELIRDARGHHKLVGGRGWDPEGRDDASALAPGGTGASYDGTKNNFSPELFPPDPNGELLFKPGEQVAMADCQQCHAGRTEHIYRDVHYSAGLECDDCHGDMAAAGSLYKRPENHRRASVDPFREAIFDEPDCGSCHMGDGNRAILRKAYDPADRSASTLVISKDEDKRFAVVPYTERSVLLATNGTTTQRNVCFGTLDCVQSGTATTGGGGHLKANAVAAADATTKLTGYTVGPLFRKSVDTHGNVACGACHGGSHAVWPIADGEANDNVTAKQLQGYDGTILECDVCHSKDAKGRNSFADGELSNTTPVAYGDRTGVRVRADAKVAYLAGPHGLHPIDDPNWYNEAEEYPVNGGWHAASAKIAGENGEDQCAACHGTDRATPNRLAKSPVDREFKDMTVEGKKKSVSIKAGQYVSCTDCHSQEISFRNTPWKDTWKSIK